MSSHCTMGQYEIWFSISDWSIIFFVGKPARGTLNSIKALQNRYIVFCFECSDPLQCPAFYK